LINIIKDPKTGRCFECDPDIYPRGKPIINDPGATKDLNTSKWICSSCQEESLNKIFLCTLGPNHPKCQAFITREDNDCKHWNNYVKRVNQTMGAGLKYHKNRYTGRTPLNLCPQVVGI